METPVTVITCNSFCELEDGTGAGARGEAPSFDAAQQALLQQWPPLQQDFAAGAVPCIATTGPAARINPSASAATHLVIFKTMSSAFYRI
jgi:hypothetical protein